MMNSNPIGRYFGYVIIAMVLSVFTNLYTFLAGVLGVPFKIIGVMFIGSMSFYCMLNFQVVSRIIKERAFGWYLALFVVLPVLSSLYSPYFEIRYVGYTVLGGLIFLSTAIWMLIEGWEKFTKLIVLCWCVCVAGIAMSYFVPGVFKSVALLQEVATGGGGSLTEVRIANQGQARAFGFYMQSNRAAYALILHLLILLPTLLHDKPMRRIFMIAVSFFAILLTGSRTGFLVLFGLTGLIVLSELRYGIKDKGRIKSGFTSIPKYIILGVLAIVITVAAMSLGKVDSLGQNAIERIFVSLFSGDYSMSEDMSVQARLGSQGAFIKQIMLSPLWGYGLFSMEWGIYTGRLPIAAHNMYLDVAYQFGLPVLLGSYGLLLYLCLCEKSKRMTQYFRMNVSVIMFTVICVYSFASNTVLEFRTFPVFAAFWMMLIFFPTSGGAGRARGRR